MGASSVGRALVSGGSRAGEKQGAVKCGGLTICLSLAGRQEDQVLRLFPHDIGSTKAVNSG